MDFHFKQTICSLLISCITLSPVAYATDNLSYTNESNPTEFLNKSTVNTPQDNIVITSESDLNQMLSQDEALYQNQLDNIPSNLSADIETFLSQNSQYNICESDISALLESNSAETANTADINLSSLTTEVDYDSMLSDFLEAYPQYSSMDQSELLSTLSTVRANPVVSAVRKFFSSKGYRLSLALFNHSLINNPAKVYMNLIDNKTSMGLYIKHLLSQDGFVNKMVAFSRSGSNYYSKTDSSYAFNSGDLYWAIHGFTWKRTRTMYNKAYFKIYDVYDFKKWKDIPGIVAGICNTHDYNIEFYGLVLGGVIK